jgi:L-arabinose isomerase
MRPDRFQVRDETIDELNEIIERLLQCVDNINDYGELVPDTHAVVHDKLIKSACNIRELVHELKNDLAVFPITPRWIRLEIYYTVKQAEQRMREYELLD